jgi:hypothetical protein
MDSQQAINLEILRRFGEESIKLPYPTQAVVVTDQPDPSGSSRSLLG